MQKLEATDIRVKIISHHRNFDVNAIILCGLSKCIGDFAVVKAADIQEYTELVLEMFVNLY